MLDQIEEMVKKEVKILFPMALKNLTPEEWGAVYRDSARFGWCLVEPGAGYQPPSAKTGAEELSGAAAIPVGVGSLLPEQLKALVEVLPVDLTFVDSDDRVAFFSEGKDRIFARSPSIIGRKVQNCHPPQSVDVVERILADFRSGKQNVAEFWINLKGRFVHIRYFAVRSGAGEYIGNARGHAGSHAPALSRGRAAASPVRGNGLGAIETAVTGAGNRSWRRSSSRLRTCRAR